MRGWKAPRREMDLSRYGFRPLHQTRLVAVLAILAAFLVGIGLLNRPGAPAAATGALSTPVQTNASHRACGSVDADEYAQEVAAIAFGMDTRVLAPGVYREMLLRDADSHLTSGQRATLIDAVDELIPSDDIWAQQHTDQRWSSWSSTQVWVPASRIQVVTGGQAEPEWVLRNVLGVQTTHATQAGAAATSSAQRTITIGMRCTATTSTTSHWVLVLVGSTVVP